jgi:hypothetical protein
MAGGPVVSSGRSATDRRMAACSSGLFGLGVVTVHCGGRYDNSSRRDVSD